MTENFEKISPRLNKLVVIGLGLIGASVASAARERNLAAEVIGLSRRSSTLELALVNGIIDQHVDLTKHMNSRLNGFINGTVSIKFK